MNILDKRATNPAAALDGTELVYVAQLGADAVTTVQDIKDFATNGFLLITTAATTYQTQTGMSAYLTTSAAASTYVAKNAPITEATKTKITYNTDGLITSGADATTADIADSSNRRYITDAQQTVLNNTSNTNSGDETTATIKTKLGTASSGGDGYLTSTDWNTFNDKQAALADVITANTYGSSTQVPVITFNAKGIATTVTLATIAAPVLTEANFSVAKTGQPTYTVSWVLTALTGAKTWTVPDTNLDFGNIAKIPAVATPYTTAAMAGTRPQCVGGSGNTFSGGTDNIAIGCTNCVMDGTRNAAYGSTKIGLASTATDNSFYNCVSTQPVELLTTIGVRYVNCSFAQLTATNSLFGGIWPNYSTVEATNENGATKCTVGLTSINFNSFALTPLTTAGSGSTEVLAYCGYNGITTHDIVITCSDYNSTSGAVFRRTVVINGVGTIVSTATPVADVTYGGTTYTPAISVVGRVLRITVASSISSDSGAFANVVSLYQ